MEYFVEYFTEKKLLFTKKRVLFWKKNDIERASKINNSLNLLAFWGKQTTGIEPACPGGLTHFECFTPNTL